MAAPQIPNLLSLRGAPRSRGRGRGQGFGTSSQSDADTQARKDKLLQATDSDASGSRMSAVNKGYLRDPYAKELALDDVPRRFPIINRGTYVRTTALDQLIENFIKSNKPHTCQIISLGAGTDTRYFRLREQHLDRYVLYHEVDFPSISVQKLNTIRSSPVLSPTGSGFFALNPLELHPETAKWGYFTNQEHTQGYIFHPLDLRTVPAVPNPTPNPGARPLFDGLKPELPTLLVSECCLCYLEPSISNNILSFFQAQIPSLGIILYEPTDPSSDFGKMMMANLASRSLYMPSIQAYPSIEAQRERLADAFRGTPATAFTGSQDGATIDWLWENWVSAEEKARLARLEMFDETEEWKMLASHYIVLWAWREPKATSHKGAFRRWVTYCTAALGEAKGLNSSLSDSNDGVSADGSSDSSSPATTPKSQSPWS